MVGEIMREFLIQFQNSEDMILWGEDFNEINKVCQQLKEKFNMIAIDIKQIDKGYLKHREKENE